MEKYRKILYIGKGEQCLGIDAPLTNSPLMCATGAAEVMKKEGEIKHFEYHTCNDVNSAINNRQFAGIGVKDSIILNLLEEKKIDKEICFIIAEANQKAEKDFDNKYLNKKYGIEKIVLS